MEGEMMLGKQLLTLVPSLPDLKQIGITFDFYVTKFLFIAVGKILSVTSVHIVGVMTAFQVIITVCCVVISQLGNGLVQLCQF